MPGLYPTFWRSFIRKGRGVLKLLLGPLVPSPTLMLFMRWCISNMRDCRLRKFMFSDSVASFG